MSSFAQPNLITNLAAGSDLSSSQYKAIVLSTDGAVDVAGANVAGVGFLMNLPTAGKSAEIATVGGGAKAKAGGTITAGDLLKTDSVGDVVTAVNGENYVALALESAVDNDIFNVLVIPPHSDITSVVQELTASGAVSAGVQSLELNHATVIIAATIATSVNLPGLFVVKDTSASGTAAHTVTLTVGTWDGTNTIITLNAPDEAIAVYFDSAGNGTILENVGGVALS
jgi:hypothetical protein